MTNQRLHHRGSWLPALLALAIAPLAMVTAARASAQGAPPGGAVATDTGRLRPVVVTATRVPFTQSVPTASTTVITGEQLEAQGITSVSAALRDVAGAAVVQTGSMGALTSLFLRGGESGYTKVLLDGVPLNEPGGVFYFQNLTTADIDRIEVVRGPTSVLYGSDAVTGVIQIFTKRGTGPPAASLEMRGGNYKSADGSAMLAGSLGRLGYSVGGTRESTAGILPFNSQYTNGELGGRIDLGLGTASSAAFTARYHTADFHFPTVGDGTPVDHNQHRRDEGSTFAFDASHHFASLIDAHVNLTANNQDAANINPQDSPADTTGSYVTFNRDVFQRVAADAHADMHLSPASVVTVGGSLEGQTDRNRAFDISNFGGIDTSTSGPAAYFRRVRAGYAQLLGNVGSAISYSAGGRIDDNSAFGTFGTYRFGLGYAPASTTQIHAAIGTAFKEPTFEQNFSTTPFDIGNTELRPERSLGWEVGITETPLGPGLSLSATYFNQRFRNIIDYSFAEFPVAGHPSDSSNYVNIAGATADGLELGLVAGPVAGTSVELSYTNLHTRVTDNGIDTTGFSEFRVGSRLIRRPSNQFSGTFRFAMGARGSISATARFVGTRDDINFNALADSVARVVLPGYTTLDLAAQYRLTGTATSGSFSVIARVTNLLDRRYDEVYSYAAPGRILLVGGRLATRP